MDAVRKEAHDVPVNEGAQVDPRIIKFVKRHHVMTVATVYEGEPYCANLFYSYMSDANLFVFTSEEKTRHYRDMLSDGFVAASVVLETRTVGNVQGVQIQGRVMLAEGQTSEAARRSYIQKFPYAIMADLTLWVLCPVFMKMTDNRLGFGKKLIWHGKEECDTAR